MAGKKKTGYLYSTIRRGTQKVTSDKQHMILGMKKLPHTHVMRSKTGKIYRKRVYSKHLV